MKNIISLFIVIILSSCGAKEERSEVIGESDSLKSNHNTSQLPNDDASNPTLTPKAYSNERFRDVTVRKNEGNTFTVTGKGQIFEASFGWVVEDGHNELMKGFESTDAGAPEWGSFEFSVAVQKQRPNSTLTLVLFETSAKDGSRQHELAIPFR
jgi:hypothetical protein